MELVSFINKNLSIMTGKFNCVGHLKKLLWFGQGLRITVEKLLTCYQSTVCMDKIILHLIISSAESIWLNEVCVFSVRHRHLGKTLHKNQSPNLHLVFGSRPSSCQIVYFSLSFIHFSTHNPSYLSCSCYFCNSFPVLSSVNNKWSRNLVSGMMVDVIQ